MSRDRFQECLPSVLKDEGGFVDDPRDCGGATNLGITIGVAREHGLDLDHDGDVDRDDVRKITVGEAGPIYRADYWAACRCDDLPAGVDRIVFDSAVNCGPQRARTWLQIAAGVKNDGNIGPHTMAAVGRASPRILVDLIAAQRKAHYQRQSNFSVFGKGWLARLAEVRATAGREAAALPQKEPAP